MILGLTGTLGAGKSTLALFLQEKGFSHLVMSDVLREELKKQNKEENRDNLLAVGNELRKKYGEGVLVERLITKAKNEKKRNMIIDGIRSLGEVEALKNHKGKLIAIDSSLEVRYKRIKKRGSSKDNISFETFKAQEAKEDLRACMKEADYLIFCDGGHDELRKETTKMVEALKNG